MYKDEVIFNMIIDYLQTPDIKTLEEKKILYDILVEHYKYLNENINENDSLSYNLLYLINCTLNLLNKDKNLTKEDNSFYFIILKVLLLLIIFLVIIYNLID